MDPDFINYVQPIPPSLKSTASVLITSILLSQPDIKIELFFLLSTPKHCEVKFCQLEEKILEKLTLIVSKDVHSNIIDFVKVMGLQLLRCFDESDEEYYNLYNHSEPDGSLTWTADGTIDKIRTLKRVILDERREKNYSVLFKLACKYCYKEYMLYLWEKVPFEYQKTMYRECIKRDYLIYYWIITLKYDFPSHFECVGDTDHIFFTHQLVTESLSKGNVLAFKYFFREEQMHVASTKYFRHFLKSCYGLSEQIPAFLRHPGSNEYADILFVLLSSLKLGDKQRKFFKTHSHLVLKSLVLHWPWQRYLTPTINAMWDYLDPKVYVEIMGILAAYAKDRNMCEVLLIDLWRCSRRVFKKCLIRNSWNIPIISKKLFQPEEIGMVLRSLRDIYDEEGMTMDNYKILLNFIDFNSFEFIDNYVCLSITSDKTLNELKSQFVKEKFPELIEKFNNQDDSQNCVEFKRFVVCFCCNGNETFKENCYEHVLDAIQKRYFKFASIILSSCHPNGADIAQLKKEMFVSKAVVDCFIRILQHSDGSNKLFKNVDWNKIKSILEWFAPFTKATIDELKSKLDSCFCEIDWSDKVIVSEKMDRVYHLMDTHVTTEDISDYYYCCASDEDECANNEDCANDEVSESVEQDVNDNVGQENQQIE